MDKGAWQIAVLFAGAALGGTYLGGYEWLRFFAYFGSWGTIGAVLASLALGWFGYSVLSICYRAHIRSLHELFLHWFGEAFGPTLSVLTHLFLLAYAGVITGQFAMQAPAGAPPLLFVLVPVLVAIVWLQKGWSWLITGMSVSLASGFLLFGLIFLEQPHVPIPNLGYQMNLNWIVHALLYVGLHFLLCLAVAIPLVKHVAHQQSIRLGVGIGSLLFFLLLITGHAILLSYWHDVHASASPFKLIMLQLIPKGDWLLGLFSLFHGGVLIAAILYALAVPITDRHDLQLLPLLLVMLSFLALFALLPMALSWSVPLVASGTTYCGLNLLIRFIWKRQAPK
ncbi:hypothetical protein [Brevibacillus centrosporus]|uniref:hypothetical protein n=1 Tax=Brevibacillus centrosporus TaxID=54910 RepID=UPI002E1C67C2|nr:hypothetical protein [Brevibacillus centrosporus]